MEYSCVSKSAGVLVTLGQTSSAELRNCGHTSDESRAIYQVDPATNLREDFTITEIICKVWVD